MNIQLNGRYHTRATEGWADEYGHLQWSWWSFLIVGQFAQGKQMYYIGIKDLKELEAVSWQWGDPEPYPVDKVGHQTVYIFDQNGFDLDGHFRLCSALPPRSGYCKGRSYPVG